MAVVNASRLEFVRASGDYLSTNKVVLDTNTRPFLISMSWRPVAASWFLSLRLTTGEWIIRDVAVRDRTDCLLGISTPDRPAGAIISYDPKRRGDPTLTSYAQDDVRLYYLPDGFNPEDFAAYTSDVTT